MKLKDRTWDVAVKAHSSVLYRPLTGLTNRVEHCIVHRPCMVCVFLATAESTIKIIVTFDFKRCNCSLSFDIKLRHFLMTAINNVSPQIKLLARTIGRNNWKKFTLQAY